MSAHHRLPEHLEPLSQSPLLGCSVLFAVADRSHLRPDALFDFLDYDDNLFVFENPQVKGGLTGSGFA